tara:strand:+ start:394 stop:927 length:534 start_codon:yes stop_codon:yes gene_type:complete
MIDELKSWGTKPTFSGLGFVFIQESNKQFRWNFYCPDLTPVEAPDFHTHRIKFESQIVRGLLINEVCKWEKSENYQPHKLVETNCINPHFEPSVAEENIKVRLDGKYSLPAGAWYISEADTFHRVMCPEKTITRLHILGKETKTNLTIKRKDQPFVCPLQDFKKPEKECWEIIRTFF